MVMTGTPANIGKDSIWKKGREKFIVPMIEGYKTLFYEFPDYQFF
jgi:hypothetical protein